MRLVFSRNGIQKQSAQLTSRKALCIKRHFQRIKLGLTHVVLRIIHGVILAGLELKLGKHGVAVKDVNVKHMRYGITEIGRIVELIAEFDDVELRRGY